MSIAVLIGVHDGLVLAADSASTLSARGPMGSGVLNVYENANKIFNLYKGERFIKLGCITFGSGGIGNSSIATLIKDFRDHITQGDLGFNRKDYSVKDVATILGNFLGEECSKIKDQEMLQGLNIGLLIGGYSSGETLGESWSVEIKKGVPAEPIELRKKQDPGISWGGMGEALNRMVVGFSPEIFNVLSQAMNTPSAKLRETLEPLLTARLQAPIVFAPMPIQDAIELSRFLVHSAIMFTRFTPGPQSVGGPIEIASITKHEGFRWIARKHYFTQELNREVSHAISNRRDDDREDAAGGAA
jgi:hypothetical protein